MAEQTPSGIVLTDPTPLPKAADDGKCPQCRAEKRRRVANGGFGRRFPVCGECGFEFREEKWHD